MFDPEQYENMESIDFMLDYMHVYYAPQADRVFIYAIPPSQFKAFTESFKNNMTLTTCTEKGNIFDECVYIDKL